MKNTLKAIGVVARLLAIGLAVAGVVVGALYVAMHGHARLVGIVSGIAFLIFAVWVVKTDLDYRDRAREKNLVCR